MEKRIEEKNDAYKKAYEEMVSNRLMIMIFIGFVALGVLILMYQRFGAAGQTSSTFTCAYILTGVFAALTVICFIWFLISRKKEKPLLPKTITSGNCLWTCFLFTVMFALVSKFDQKAIKALYIIIPAYVALYFIKKVYPKDFFVTAACGAYGIVSLYIL